MNRCLLVFFWACTALAAQAQLSEPLAGNDKVIIQEGTPGLRKFPDKALRGKMQVVQAPEILIDGKRERLSPGARIRATNNLLVLPANLTGQEFIVNFVRNGAEVHEVWILTELEAKQKLKTNTPARNFSFASEEGVAKQDDGKTPFNQLPTFEQLGRQQRARQ